MQVNRNLQRIHELTITNIRRWLIKLYKLSIIISSYVHDDRHSRKKLSRGGELLAVVNLLPLRETRAFVFGALTHPVQEIQMGQVMEDVGYRPGHRHREYRQRDQQDVQGGEEEQIDYPDSSAIPPGHLWVASLRSCGWAQHGYATCTIRIGQHHSLNRRCYHQRAETQRVYCCYMLSNINKLLRYDCIGV